MVKRIDFTKKDGTVDFSHYYCNCKVPVLGYVIASGSYHLCTTCSYILDPEYSTKIGQRGGMNWSPLEGAVHVPDRYELHKSMKVQKFLEKDITVVTIQELNR